MRVVVRGRERSTECQVAAHVPVVEVVPVLARVLGLLDPHRVHLGLLVTTADGTVLSAERSLAEQGVRQGDVLTVEPPEVTHKAAYDDLADAVADAVDAQELDFTKLRQRVALGWCAVFACATTAGLVEQVSRAHATTLTTAGHAMIAALCLTALSVMATLLSVSRKADSASGWRRRLRGVSLRRGQTIGEGR